MNTITQRFTRKTINDPRFLGNTLIEVENTEETKSLYISIVSSTKIIPLSVST